jgi:high-affinity K+ transport system ATPase subunit B
MEAALPASLSDEMPEGLSIVEFATNDYAMKRPDLPGRPSGPLARRPGSPD